MASPTAARAAWSTLVGLPLLLVPAGCGGSGGDSGGAGGLVPGARLSGTMSVFFQDGTTLEAEPNDTLATAHVLGDLGAGDSVAVYGSVRESGADTVDVFELRAPARVLVDLTLTGITPSSDLDVYVVDAISQQPVQRYITSSANESGSFAAAGTFFVVVDSFSQDSDYELRLDARAVAGAIAESEPNDQPRDGDYLGTLQSGAADVLLAGDGAGGSPDHFLVSTAGGTGFSFQLASSGTSDYDVYVYDATSDIHSPPLIASFDAPGTGETGQVNAPAMTLFAVEVRPFQGASAPYTMSIQGTQLRLAGGAAPPISAAPRARAAGLVDLARGGDVLRRAVEDAPPVWPGDVIVRWDAGRGRLAPGGEAGAEAAAEVVAAVPGGGPEKLRFPVPAGLDAAEAARHTAALAAALRGRGDVVHAEPDLVLQALALPQERRPDDTFYNLQWHYEQIGLPAAWHLTRGSNAVRVAVLDTGSAPSSDLAPREIPGVDMISSAQIAGDGDGIDGDPTDVGDGLGTPQPSSFHGAHVAGTIGAATDNGSGVAGVTWLGRIMHVRVLGIGGGSSFDIANGVLYAAGLPNSAPGTASPRVDVINMSLGGPGFSQTFQDAVTAARNAGCVVIAAAGNEDSSTPSYPAAYDGVVSVAAVDLERRRAPYSNFHPTVDIAAPGGDVSADRNGDGYADGVLSTKPDDSVNPTNFESYSFYQGTSMAAPHVAGVAALLLAVAPNLTPVQVESILASTATDLGEPGRDVRYGEGLVNAFAAVQSAAGGGGANPILSLDRSSVLLEGDGDTRRVGVANAGGGSLQLTGLAVNTVSGGSWLSASAIPAGQTSSTDTAAIELRAAAGGLADGVYAGTVRVESSGGAEVLNVSLAVGGGGTAPRFEVFVLAVDAETYATEAQDEVLTDQDLSYLLAGLPAGRYLVVAGTDEDGDGIICDAGEPLCGLYPSLNDPVILAVGEDGAIGGLDFPLQESVVSSSAGPPGGYRLLRPRTPVPGGEVRR